MNNLDRYYNFIKEKIQLSQDYGFNISDSEMSSILKPHQRDAVRWAIRGGRRALFESFGLGKTIQQLEICRLIIAHEGYGKALIVMPLGIKQEFIQDARNLLGMEVEYVRTNKEVNESFSDILLTNYERVRDGDINPDDFICTSLDEASVLRSFGSKTYQTFLDKFKNVKFKFVCTATPSPNKYKELIHYAGYLGVMDTGQALTRFFQRDSKKANNLTIYPHKEKEFWLWVSSWALFITDPSDLGYPSEGYKLPNLKMVYHELKVDHLSAGINDDGQVKMFRDAAVGLKDAAREKRDSIDTRVAKMLDIISENINDNFIIWHDLENERHAIRKALPEVFEVYGSQDRDERENNLIDFSNGKIKYLATKPEISGSGCNFQRHCNKAIFLGIGYPFNDFIQAIHRIYRFLQSKEVEIYVIYMESENEVLKVLLEKWKQHNYLIRKMIEIIRENGLNITNSFEKLVRTINIDRKEKSGNHWKAVNNDNVIETSTMLPNSVHLIVTSIPFSNHYEYTPSYLDFGHNINNSKFFEQLSFLTPNLLNILVPGRILAVHVKDRVLFGSQTGLGMPTIEPFHAECIYHYMNHGFNFMGMITVVTDVVRENNQTYRLGWSEQCKDGSKMGVGCPEYILLFRKTPTDKSNAYSDIPVVKDKKNYTRARWQIDAHSFWKSSGNRFLSSDELKHTSVDKVRKYFRDFDYNQLYDYENHVAIAEQLDEIDKLPGTFMVVDPVSKSDQVWDEVLRIGTLNTEQSRKKLQNHICPLQFDIVDRLINRYSNEGEVVYDPFAGLFTVPFRAIKLGRKGLGTELNYDSYIDGIRYLETAENNKYMPSLFSMEELN